MKRYLIGFSLLLVLAAGLLMGTSLAVNSRRDRVEVREEVLLGSREAAEGLTVGLRMRNYSYGARGLAWHTRFTIGAGDVEPETDFTYRPSTETHWDQLLDDRSRLDLETWGYGGSTNGGSGYDFSHWLEAPAQDVAARTDAGQRRTETVPMADYYDSFPWILYSGSIYIGAPEGEQTSQQPAELFRSTDEAVSRRLAELFRVPVEPDYYLLVTVGKKSAGQIVEYGVFPAEAPQEPVTSPMPDGGAAGADEGEPAWPESRWDRFSEFLCLADTEAGLWIYPSVRTEDGRELVEYRDGPGVYLLPRISAEKFRASQGGADPDSLDLEEARLAYATDAAPLYLRASPDGSRLLLWARKDGRLSLTVIDTRTCQAERVTDLLPMEAEQDRRCRLVEQNGLYLLTLWNGDTVLAAETEYGYDAVLWTHLESEQIGTAVGDDAVTLWNLFHSGLDLDLAWDGERLAVCGEDIQTQQWIVLVADETGLRFLGRYDYSPLWDGVWDGAASWDSSYLPAMTVQWAAAP